MMISDILQVGLLVLVFEVLGVVSAFNALFTARTSQGAIAGFFHAIDNELVITTGLIKTDLGSD